MGKRSLGDVNALRLRSFEMIERGLSLPEIADLLGVSLRTIQRWKSTAQPETTSLEDCPQAEIDMGVSEQVALEIDELIPISVVSSQIT